MCGLGRCYQLWVPWEAKVVVVLRVCFIRDMKTQVKHYFGDSLFCLPKDVATSIRQNQVYLFFFSSSMTRKNITKPSFLAGSICHALNSLKRHYLIETMTDLDGICAEGSMWVLKMKQQLLAEIYDYIPQMHGVSNFFLPTTVHCSPHKTNAMRRKYLCLLDNVPWISLFFRCLFIYLFFATSFILLLYFRTPSG